MLAARMERTASAPVAVAAFLNSQEGEQLQKHLVRGVFGLLKKHSHSVFVSTRWVRLG